MQRGWSLSLSFTLYALFALISLSSNVMTSLRDVVDYGGEFRRMAIERHYPVIDIGSCSNEYDKAY